VQAIASHGAVTALPGPCRRLGPASLSQAVRIAVSQLSDHGDKAEQRHLAGRARNRVGVLIAAAQRAAAQQAMARRHRPARRCGRAGRCGARSGPRSSGVGIPVSLAALGAWLLTAASGGVLLAKWLAHRGPRHHGRSPGGSGAVIFSHLGLAVAGLAAWIGYLLPHWAPLAWVALFILLPVAGLGMAALVQAIPEPDRAPSHRSVLAAVQTRNSAPVVMIAAHGVLATATLLLALLGSVAALGSH
jgi:hypothetical protein